MTCTGFINYLLYYYSIITNTVNLFIIFVDLGKERRGNKTQRYLFIQAAWPARSYHFCHCAPAPESAVVLVGTNIIATTTTTAARRRREKERSAHAAAQFTKKTTTTPSTRPAFACLSAVV